MKIFLLNSIWELQFVPKENLYKIFWDEITLSNIFWINWYITNIDESSFHNFLPLINWYFWIFYYFKSTKFDYNLTLWNNLLDITFNDTSVDEFVKNLNNIIKRINTWVLLTKSLKSELSDNIKLWVNWILKNIFTIYFFVLESLQNKEELKKLVKDEYTPDEFKAHASLLQEVWFNKEELLVNRLEFLLENLMYICEMYVKYINVKFISNN